MFILKLNKKVANVLRWEGVVIDPLGALLAVLVFNFIISVKIFPIETEGRSCI